MTRPHRSDVVEARERIAGIAIAPLLHPSPRLSRMLGCEVRLALEFLQPSGSFKIRGSANRMLALRDDSRGVVTYSTGNHGRAVAHLGDRLGMPAVVCVSSLTTQSKIDAFRAHGAEVVVAGTSQDEATEAAAEIARDRGLDLIDPIEDAEIIAGHGTLGLDILDAWPGVETIVVPVSGGALAAGVCLAVEDRADVVGATIRRGGAMYASLEAGHPVEVEETPSIADSLQGGIGLANRHTFELCRQHLARLVPLGEQDIEVAMAAHFLLDRLVVEGAAAAPLATTLTTGDLGERVCLVLTGATVDPLMVAEVARTHRSSIEGMAS